jgi:hypothetical protein
MSIRLFSGRKCGRYVGLTALPPSCVYCLEIWEPQRPGFTRACHGVYWIVSPCLYVFGVNNCIWIVIALMCYTDSREFIHSFPIFPRKVELISKPPLLLVTFTI